MKTFSCLVSIPYHLMQARFRPCQLSRIIQSRCLRKHWDVVKNLIPTQAEAAAVDVDPLCKRRLSFPDLSFLGVGVLLLCKIVLLVHHLRFLHH